MSYLKSGQKKSYQKKTGKKNKRALWQAVLIGSCLSSVPVKSPDLVEFSADDDTKSPPPNPQSISAEAASLAELSTEEIIARFFSQHEFIAHANAKPLDSAAEIFPYGPLAQNNVAIAMPTMPPFPTPTPPVCLWPHVIINGVCSVAPPYGGGDYGDNGYDGDDDGSGSGGGGGSGGYSGGGGGGGGSGGYGGGGGGGGSGGGYDGDGTNCQYGEVLVGGTCTPTPPVCLPPHVIIDGVCSVAPPYGGDYDDDGSGGGYSGGGGGYGGNGGYGGGYGDDGSGGYGDNGSGSYGGYGDNGSGGYGGYGNGGGGYGEGGYGGYGDGGYGGGGYGGYGEDGGYGGYGGYGNGGYGGYGEGYGGYGEGYGGYGGYGEGYGGYGGYGGYNDYDPYGYGGYGYNPYGYNPYDYDPYDYNPYYQPYYQPYYEPYYEPYYYQPYYEPYYEPYYYQPYYEPYYYEYEYCYYYDEYYYYPELNCDGNRLPDPPLVKASPPDFRYRDMCIATAPLPQNAFDSRTGLVRSAEIGIDTIEPFADYDYYAYQNNNGGDYYDDYEYGYEDGIPEAISPFHERFVGRVSGAKPPLGACMPIKNTPLVQTSNFSDPDQKNRMFSYYLNLNASRDNIIYNSNAYRDRTDFLAGGVLSCPEIELGETLENTRFQRSNADKFALMNILRAKYCYNYYILNHAMRPWHILEKPGIETDDPLTKYDSDRAYLSSCQPLIDGNSAAYVQYKAHEDRFANEKSFGYSPVLRYWNLPHWDEAEYILGNILQDSWNNNRPYWQGIEEQGPYPQHYRNVSLPCIENRGGALTGFEFPPGNGGGGPGKQCRNGQNEDNGGNDSGDNRPTLPPDYHYVSPPTVGKYYCPNVERINDPENPFSPRTYIAGTDNSYSSMTFERRCVEWSDPEETRCIRSSNGYVGKSGQPYQEIELEEGGPKHQVWHVTCGAVPVDILSFRSAAFDSCIKQRIEYNFQQWIKEGGEDMSNDERDPSQLRWYKCKTRYWETDNYCECPVKMSIQQCCRILTKDVVPANFLKMRTTEGLRDRIRNDEEIQDLLEPYGYEGDDYDPYGYDEGNPTNLEDPAAFNNDIEVHKRALRVHKRMLELAGNSGTEPEEYHFRKYFTDHMPYMRWWDTGVASGNPYHGGSFTNTLGAFDTIIGVGREERDEQDGKNAAREARDNDFDLRASRLRAPQSSEMGRFGGWTELKAHQMQTTRRYNMSCIGRYEKLFKQGGGENFALAKAGSGYISRDGKPWPWPLGWRGYVTAPGPSQFPYAFGLSESVNNPFRNGLDNALPGDIITYEISGVTHIAYVTDIGFAIEINRAQMRFDNSIEKYRDDETGEILIPEKVFVINWDQGKFPTSTGMSISWGMGPERTIYKQKVPATNQVEFCANKMSALTDIAVKNPDSGEITVDNVCRNSFGASGTGADLFLSTDCLRNQCQPSCEDPDLSSCVLPSTSAATGWDNVRIYRPDRDVRQCQNATISGAPPNSSFDIDATYRWIMDLSGSTTVLGSSNRININPNVIYPYMTDKIDSNMWSYCVNSGYDAPGFYSKEYSGPQTGAITDNTLCGPQWGECSAAHNVTRFYPRGWRIYKDPQ